MMLRTPCRQSDRERCGISVRAVARLSLSLSLAISPTYQKGEPARAREREKKSESSGVRAGVGGERERREARYRRDIRIHLYADLTRRRAAPARACAPRVCARMRVDTSRARRLSAAAGGAGSLMEVAGSGTAV